MCIMSTINYGCVTWKLTEFLDKILWKVPEINANLFPAIPTILCTLLKLTDALTDKHGGTSLRSIHLYRNIR